MRRFARPVYLVLAAMVLSSLAFAATTVDIKPERESGVYDPGQTVTGSIDVPADKKPASGKIPYIIRLGGLDEVGKGEVDIVDGKATVTGTRADPGTLLLQIKIKPAEGKELVLHGGAIFAPDKIAPSAPPPDDFDKFWSDKVAALKAIPMNVQLTPVDIGVKGIEYFKVTFDNINGTKIYGQLAKPAGVETNLPALLQVQWAGVYKLERGWVVDQAKNGWLALNIEAHNLPIDESAEFYKEKAAKELNDYPGIGNDDREKAYFLPMFLSCYRAVDYLTERPEWNKKTVLVHGGSQGGYQTLVIAGLHPGVTAYAANVPAGCDHTGKQAKRAPGWPNWASRTWQKKDYAKMLETSRYFDAMNFAGRIKCPGIIGFGLIDTVCPAEGVAATINKIQGPKKVIIMPRSGHGGEGLPHGAYYAVFGSFLNEHKAK